MLKAKKPVPINSQNYHSEVIKRQSPKHFDTHKALIKLVFTHNHPIEPAHVLRFRPVADKTKKEYIRLFSLGHSASSAHHYYKEEVLVKKGQNAIADSAKS